MAEFRRTVYLVLGLLAATAMPTVPLRAQSDRTSWNNLKKAEAGQETEIVLNDATSYKGTLKSWNDTGIVAQVSTGETMSVTAGIGALVGLVLPSGKG
jgi:hypothetical protein